MPPTAEIDPQARLGLGNRTERFIVAGLAVGTALLASSANALAHDTSPADAEKAALEAYKTAPTRSIESFPAPASLLTVQVVEAPFQSASTATEASVSYQSDDSGEEQPPSSGETPPAEETPPEDTNLSDAELKKLCVSTGLPFETVSSYMAKPGFSRGLGGNHGVLQNVQGKFLYNLMPDVCKDKFMRAASFLVQIKDKTRNIWRNMTLSGKKQWQGLQIDEAGEYTDQEGKAWAELSEYPGGHDGPPSDPNSYYFNKNCRPVRSLIKTKILKNDPYKIKIKKDPFPKPFWVTRYPIAGQKIKRVAVELLGKCAKRTKR